jgi:hypothetical protein
MGVKPDETGGGEFAQQARQVAEMVRRCGMRHARLTCGAPERQGAQTIAVENRLSGLQHGGAKVAMVIGPARHAAIPINQSFQWQYLN